MEYDFHEENSQREHFQNGYHHYQTGDEDDQFQGQHQGVQCQTQ
jgi:hypothetical protein